MSLSATRGALAALLLTVASNQVRLDGRLRPGFGERVLDSHRSEKVVRTRVSTNRLFQTVNPTTLSTGDRHCQPHHVRIRHPAKG